MCGIAGFVDFAGHDRDQANATIRAMTRQLEHRGPDEVGYYADDYAALGHRRLSIIDLSSGKQPMSAINERYHLVFNGEIYNFRDVRQSLVAEGCRFETNSDTEVLLHAFVTWGERCLDPLVGMFAFAIWDRVDRALFIARDRVGKKPLYYSLDGSKVVFGSELKALRQFDSRDMAIDHTSIDAYLSLGYIPGDKSIYKTVEKLRPAHFAWIREHEKQVQCYWRPDFSSVKTRNADQVDDQFEELFDRAVACRLVSDVPIGAFLSAGLDSSLVVSSMAKSMLGKVNTFTVGFAGEKDGEAEPARRISQYLNTRHTEFILQPDVANTLESVAWHLDEPFADSSALPTWYACRAAREATTVVLSGDGGDELFGGYTFRYQPHILESRVRSILPNNIRKLLFGPLGRLWPQSARLPRALRLKTIFENLSDSDMGAYYSDLVWLRQDTRQKVYRSDFMASLCGFTPKDLVGLHYLNSDAPNALGRIQNADINVYLPDDVLVKVDRMSMAHSLEVRSPLLDHRLLEFAATLGPDDKLLRGKGKLPLRRLAAKRLPADVLNFPKRGFSLPISEWLRSDLKSIAGDTVLGQSGLIDDVLDRTMLNRLWDEHQSARRDHSVFIWAVLMLGLWDRHHRSAQPLAA